MTEASKSESMRDLTSETENSKQWSFQDRIDHSKPIFWYNIYADENIDFKRIIEEIKIWTTKVKFLSNKPKLDFTSN